MITDNPKVRWLPSRYLFALPRLVALVRFHLDTSAPGAERLVFATSGAHCAFESYGVSLWLSLTILAYLCAVLPVVVALFLMIIVIQVPMYVGGLTIARTVGLNSKFYMATVMGASAYFATRQSPARFAAYFFFVIVGANAIAAAVMLTLRATVRRMERECGL